MIFFIIILNYYPSWLLQIPLFTQLQSAFVQVPACLTACPTSAPSPKSSPTQSQPPHLPEQEILWTFVAHWSCGSSCVYYYAICMTILQFQVVPEDTNQTCCHNTPLLKHAGNKPHTASHGSSEKKILKEEGRQIRPGIIPFLRG